MLLLIWWPKLTWWGPKKVLKNLPVSYSNCPGFSYSLIFLQHSHLYPLCRCYTCGTLHTFTPSLSILKSNATLTLIITPMLLGNVNFYFPLSILLHFKIMFNSFTSPRILVLKEHEFLFTNTPGPIIYDNKCLTN